MMTFNNSIILRITYNKVMGSLVNIGVNLIQLFSSKILLRDIRFSAVVCGTLIIAPTVEGRPVPQSLKIDEIQVFYAEIDQLIKNNSDPERGEKVKEFLTKLKAERARNYEDSVIRVESKRENATMGTRVNFTTERKNLSFSIKPPFPGLLLHNYTKKPITDPERHSRVKPKPAVANHQTGEVAYSLTIIEPDLAERNVHVTYWAWVDYRYTAEAALEAVQREFVPVMNYAQERLNGAKQQDEEARLKQVENVVSLGNLERTKSTKSESQVKVRTDLDNSISSNNAKILALMAAIFGFLTKMLGELVAHIIKGLYDKWIHTKKIKANSAQKSRKDEVEIIDENENIVEIPDEEKVTQNAKP